MTNEGLKHLAGLDQLQTLVLVNNPVTDEGLRFLSGMKGLRKLYLRGTYVTPGGIQVLQEALPGCTIAGPMTPNTDPADAEATRMIETLGGMIRRNELAAGEPIFFVGLPGSAVIDAQLKTFAGLKQLAGLDLRDTKITDAGLVHLAGLKQLTGLSLGDTRVSDAGLAHLAGLKQLRTLDLSGTKVTANGIKMLRTALPDCKIEGP